ncbi:MAG: hypothetical protein EOP19_26450 [Hyphomicrobiales bacterium]|nr:MAG: hypothetical protein EOP19_26450 [Hyphomicrobiales bacterium]
MSPVGDKRGWLRAEFMLDLPEGAALEVTFASTNDEELRYRVDQIARDDAMTQRDRLDRIWAEFETAQEARIGGLFVLEGAAVDEAPIAVPLHDSNEQWLWLKLELTIPASVGTPGLSEMRVLYPEISLMARLPTMFSEPRNDPEGTLRGIVGVLETTTQSIDETIGNIGRLFDARHAPDDWLDYLGSWLDLPWHDALPADIKRAFLTKAGELIGLRGTRDGLRVLLGCLLGEKSIIDIVDLTVDYAPLRLSAGVTVPALLAGRRPTHVLGRMRLNCPPADCTPLATLVPTLRLALTVTSDTRRAIAPLLDAILDQFVPLGVRTVVSWQVQPAAMFLGEDDIVVLGTESGAALGEDSIIGRAQIGGRDRDHLTESGFEIGVRLR